MDAERFDSLLRAITLSRSRRDAIRIVTASAAGAVGLAQVREAAAQCIENGKRCDPKADPNGCCSGKCSRRRKRCKAAPNQDTCTVEQNFCAQTAESSCGVSDNCLCFVTTRGQSFCGATNSAVECDSDDDCKGVFSGDAGKGARCVQSGGICNGGDPTPVCAIRCTDV